MFTIETYLQAKEVGGPHVGKKGAPMTIRNYATALRSAEKLLGKPLAKFTEEDGQLLLHNAYLKNYHQATINQMLAALKNAFAWAIGTKKYHGVNPFSNIMSSEVHRAIPTILSVEQINLFIETVDRECGRKFTLIFSLMGYSGLRINEALTLRKKDVLKDGILIVGKGNKPAFVPVKADVLKLLHEFIQQNPYTDYVFYGRFERDRNQPIRTPSVYNQFKKAVRIAGLPTDISPHTLRHSFATHALHKTKRIELVQKFLRHKNINTTMFYAQISKDEIKEAHNDLF